MNAERARAGGARAALRGREWLALLVAVWLFGGGPLAGEDPPTVTASGGTGRSASGQSRPATEPALISVTPATRPVLREIAPAATVEQALAYTDAERIILDDVRDRDGQLDAQALYVLLRRAEMLPEGPQALAEADRPNVKNFWREPDRYRSKLVVVDGRFVKKQDWSAHATPTRWWGTRKVWAVHLREVVTGEGRGMVVMLTREPPDRIPVGRLLRFPGLFYKLVTFPEDGETGDASKTQEYPVIVARSIYTTRGRAAGISTGTYVMFGLVILLFAAFFVLRRLAKGREAGPVGRYMPLRFEKAADRAAAGIKGEQPGPVDEELVRQLEALKDGKRKPGDTDDADDATDPR